jgi:hypothetical protein
VDLGTLLKNLNRLAGTDAEDLPHGDTVADYLAVLPYEELANLPAQMVQRLIRMRALEHGRIFGRYMIAIDGTGIWTFSTRHCDHCLTQQQGTKTIYYHMVLEAKLVTPDGISLSVASEFIQNTDPKATKQDCEHKAILRVMETLKARFSRLPVCLLLDAEHANQTVFSVCKQLHWDWIMTFKKGSLPTAWDEFWRLKALAPENILQTRVNDRYQRLTWVTDLQHEGHTFSALDCLTYNEEGQVQYFAWITNLRVNWSTVVELANRGGRTRWKIENQGFNNQKNHGYELEHVYSQNENAGKGYYILLQIAHTMVQLLLKGRLARAFKITIQTLKNFFIRMADSLRHDLISPAAICQQATRSIQIRLDSS